MKNNNNLTTLREAKLGGLYRSLEEFKNAYLNLVEAIDVIENEDVDTINDFLSEGYPFEASFDDLGLCDWVDSIQEKMMETYK